MKLIFDSNQDFQSRARLAVTGLLEGLGPNDCKSEIIADERMSMLPGTIITGNTLPISNEKLLDNLKRIQEDVQNDIREEERCTELSYISNEENPAISFPNFNVEMETGTGKTYVYFRTIMDMHKLYGLTKFIILVPSVAIREGVTNSSQTFREHFREIYPGINWSVTTYSTKSISEIRDFALESNIQILIMNIDSFNKKDINLFYQENESLGNAKPIDFIRATNPVLIVDEPQSVANTILAKNAMTQLKPAICLRYSATHKEKHPLLHRLSPIRAYELGLVKKILVNSVTEVIGDDHAYLLLKSVSKSLKATLEVDVMTDSGVVRKSITVSPGDDLMKKCNRSQYEGYVVEDIDRGVVPNEVSFENGEVLHVGEKTGLEQDYIFREMIDQMVLDHMLKERELSKRSGGERIKVLSLCFIDKVANYHLDSTEPKFRTWFEESYKKYISQKRFNDLQLPEDSSAVHAGYFAVDNKGVPKDSKEKSTKADNNAFELIMKDKERLLRHEEPLRFIFSHSALREGWDNPNVFQICNLQQVNSNVKKRQQIGRGLRLPVQVNGIRCHDPHVNKLTIIANDSLANFASELQSEMIEAGCLEWENSMVKSSRKRRVLNLREDWKLNPDFKTIWDVIKQKTRYSVSFSTEDLIQRVVERIDNSELTIKPISIQVNKAQLESYNSEYSDLLRQRETSVDDKKVEMPDPVVWLQNYTELSRTTIGMILRSTIRLNEIYTNPQQFLNLCLESIHQTLEDLLIEGIQYELTGEFWDMNLFEKYPLESYLSNEDVRKTGEVHRGILDITSDGSLYDGVIFDSQVEQKFGSAAAYSEDTSLFFKLPHWFKIDTPIGKHNPDWVLLHGSFSSVILAETKATDDISELKGSERRKILAGRKHANAIPNCAYFGPISSFERLLKQAK